MQLQKISNTQLDRSDTLNKLEVPNYQGNACQQFLSSLLFLCRELMETKTVKQRSLKLTKQVQLINAQEMDKMITADRCRRL